MFHLYAFYIFFIPFNIPYDTSAYDLHVAYNLCRVHWLGHVVDDLPEAHYFLGQGDLLDCVWLSHPLGYHVRGQQGNYMLDLVVGPESMHRSVVITATVLSGNWGLYKSAVIVPVYHASQLSCNFPHEEHSSCTRPLCQRLSESSDIYPLIQRLQLYPAHAPSNIYTCM